MREYRHRGKRKEDGYWVYGNFVQTKHGANIVDDSKWYKVYPETVGQYTGLKDNVKDEEWYEGDVLTPNPHSERTELEVICFDSHQGKYKSVPISLYRSNAGNGGWTGYDVKCYQKRLGNIHDNPSLLEAK